MLDVRFRPIEKWPGTARAGKRSPFVALDADAYRILERELRQLGARNVVIHAHFRAAQIRADGWPRAGERPAKAGVIVEFDSRKGHLTFPCDTFLKWTDNLRAIALALEALRKVDRYGVTQNNQQYIGWQQLPAPGQTAHFESAEAAADFIILQSRVAYGQGNVIRDENVRREAFRKAAYHLHPDRGGNPEMFHLLNEALALLDAQTGGAA